MGRKVDTDAVQTITDSVNAQLAERPGVFVVALDGMSGTGKTTIAREVAKRLDAVNVLCDDFFIGGYNTEWTKRSPQEMIDTVIDWRRMRREVVEPLRAGRPARWHPFDWKAGKGLDAGTITAQPKRVVLLEGAYTARKELSDVVDFAILVTMPHGQRVERVIEREGEDHSKDWHATWQEAMDHYFDTMRPPSSFDLVVEAK
jgi:uridine kinase